MSAHGFIVVKEISHTHKSENKGRTQTYNIVMGRIWIISVLFCCLHICLCDPEVNKHSLLAIGLSYGSASLTIVKTPLARPELSHGDVTNLVHCQLLLIVALLGISIFPMYMYSRSRLDA